MQGAALPTLRQLVLLFLLTTAEPQTCPEIEMEQPQACPQSVEMTKPVRVLVAVRSTRRERRDAIRDTWCQAAARVAAWSNVSIAVRFWVGGGSIMEDSRTGAESELFGDMAHTTHIALNDDEALARAALQSFDLHAAAPTHWVTVTDATFVYMDPLAEQLMKADEKTCRRAGGSALLGRAAAVAALSAEPWLSACDDASQTFHAARGRRTPENARRVSRDTVAVAGFEPGEFALLEQGEDVDAALTYRDDGRIHEWVVEENVRVEVPATCAARNLIRDRVCAACAEIGEKCGAVLDGVGRLARRLHGVANCTTGGAPCRAARPPRPIMTLGFGDASTVDLWKRCAFEDEDGDGACDAQRAQAVLRRRALRRTHDELMNGSEANGGACAEVRYDLRDALVEAARGALRGVEEVALWDFPAHGNRGDSAIWSGEVALLRRLNVSVRTDLVCSSFVPVAAAPACDGWLEDEGQKLRRAFPPSSTRALVLHGGGNVGPEYPPYEEFRKNVVETFGRDYRIVLMPQTVTYADEAASSLNFWRAAANATLLGRDARSRELLHVHACGGGVFCQAALAPDAAFALTSVAPSPSEREVLWLARGDAERAQTVDRAAMAAAAADVSIRWDDLQPGEGPGDVEAFCSDEGHCVLDDLLGEPHLLAAHRVGEAFASLGHSAAVVTDRLHGVILALLAGRPVAALDVRNRKVSRFVDTWLRDAPRCAAVYASPAEALGAALALVG